MRLSPSVRGPLAMLFAGALGCSEATGPLDGYRSAGTYVLRQVAGELLPAVAYANENVVLTIVADTLFLRGDGTGRLGSTRLVEAPTALPEYVRSASEIRYTIRRGRIEGEFVCPPNALCARPPHFTGTLGSTGLRFDYMLNLRVPFHYERIRHLP